MKRLAIIIAWFFVVIIDGVVLPALTGLPTGFGIIIFLSAFAISFGIHRWVIILGIVLAFVTELNVGTYFGIIIGAWLVIAWAGHLMNRFFNMKPVNENDSLISILPIALLGFVLFCIGEVTLWVISRFVYESGLSMATLLQIMRSPKILAGVVAELMVVLSIFRLVYSPGDSVYG